MIAQAAPPPPPQAAAPPPPKAAAPPPPAAPAGMFFPCLCLDFFVFATLLNRSKHTWQHCASVVVTVHAHLGPRCADGSPSHTGGGGFFGGLFGGGAPAPAPVPAAPPAPPVAKVC